MAIKHDPEVEICGYTRTHGFTQPDPYTRVRVGVDN